MSLNIQNSWYMSKPLSDCKNLFSREETFRYQAHFYYCECGNMEVLLSLKTEIPLYKCVECENIHFIDAIKVKGYFELQQNANLNLSYECIKLNDGYMVNAYLHIPFQADFLRKQLFFKKEFIANLKVSFSKKQHLFYLPAIDFRAKNQLKQKIRQFIIEDTGSNVLYYKDSLKTEEKTYPFLFSPNLKETEFYFWKKMDLRSLRSPRYPIGVEDMLCYLLMNRKERSLKRTLFQKYTELLSNEPTPGSFDPVPPFVISRCFDDPNIALKLLKNDSLISNTAENPMYRIHDLIWLIMFLKNHYREKQIAKMLLDFKNDWYMWSDIISLVSGNKRIFKREFKKVKLTLENLHNEMVDCTVGFRSKRFDNWNFTYEKNYQQACTTVDNLEFKLPPTSKELNNWASIMHNCISGYGYTIKERKTTIYGAFRDDILLYVIEATPLEIREMSGKYNSEISDEDTHIIHLWWEKYLFQKW